MSVPPEQSNRRPHAVAGDVMEDDPIATDRTIRLTLCGLAGIIGLTLLSGCAHVYDPIDDALTCLHCEVEAAQTWHYVHGNYSCVQYAHHFGAGFRAGYVEVCRGGSGCPPTLPPKCYWGIWYRNAAGRAKTVEWFNGFSAGAAAAMQDGHQQYGQLVTASDASGQCGCNENVEYDLSDLGSENPLAPPATSSPHAAQPTYDQPQTHDPAASLAPSTEQWPSANRWQGVAPHDSRPEHPQPPFGHSIPAPTKQPVLPPPPATTPQTPSPQPQPLAPPSALEIPPATSQPSPFGHSIESSSRPPDTEQPLAEPPQHSPVAPVESPSPPPAQTLQTQPPASQNQPPHRNPDPWSRTSRDTPSSVGTPSELPSQEADDRFPPLEDRFLPRPGQLPATSPSHDATSAQYQSRPASLFEAFRRIERTSYAGQTGG